MKDYELSEYDAGVLVSDREMADFFEEVLKSTKFAKKHVTGSLEMFQLT